jgi:hypothetical protein
MNAETVADIENAVLKLSRSSLEEFAEWFDEYRERSWDEQIESDSAAGRFDALIGQAKAEHDAGRTRPL